MEDAVQRVGHDGGKVIEVKLTDITDSYVYVPSGWDNDLSAGEFDAPKFARRC